MQQTEPTLSRTGSARSAERRDGTERGNSTVDALMTPAEAAALLGVSKKALERWRGTGDGPTFVRLSATTVRYRRQDIDAFIASRLRTSTAG